MANTFRPSEINQLLTQNEKSRFEALLKGETRKMSETDLKRRIIAARNLCDKYRELTRRQKSSQSGTPLSKEAAARTKMKARIFKELLELAKQGLKQKQEKPTRTTSRSKRSRPGTSYQARHYTGVADL